jgi:nicotinamidase-related amidase
MPEKTKCSRPTAVVFIDPQNDVLSEKGANWGAVDASVTQNRTVENMERIFRAAKANGYQVFISPHYFYPNRHRLSTQSAAGRPERQGKW